MKKKKNSLYMMLITFDSGSYSLLIMYLPVINTSNQHTTYRFRSADGFSREAKRERERE